MTREEHQQRSQSDQRHSGQRPGQRQANPAKLAEAVPLPERRPAARRRFGVLALPFGAVPDSTRNLSRAAFHSMRAFSSAVSARVSSTLKLSFVQVSSWTDWTFSRAPADQSAPWPSVPASRRAPNSASSSRPTPRVRFWISFLPAGVELHLASPRLLQRCTLPFLLFLRSDYGGQFLLFLRQISGHLLARWRALQLPAAGRCRGEGDLRVWRSPSTNSVAS